MVPRNVLWQHRDVIEVRSLTNDHPDLVQSPLLRAALMTLRYAREHGSIGLTKTMAYKRVFVHWAVENFAWPGKTAVEIFRYGKVINEYEFPPLEVLHSLLITLSLGGRLSRRHIKRPIQESKSTIIRRNALTQRI